MAARKTPSRPRKASGAAPKKPAPKSSLVANINRRKKAGKSRPKRAGTVSKEAYAAMEAGWPAKSATKTRRRRGAKKRAAKRKTS